jgi:hypothetical protein
MLCHCDLCSQTLKIVGRVSTTGRSHLCDRRRPRTRRLAGAFVRGIHEDSAAYPVEMFRRAGDSGVLRIGTDHQSGQTGTVGTRGGAQSRFAIAAFSRAYAAHSPAAITFSCTARDPAVASAGAGSAVDPGRPTAARGKFGRRRQDVHFDERRQDGACIYDHQTSACTATAASRRSVRRPARCDIRNATRSGGRTHKFTLFAHVTRSGSDLGSANTAQGLNLERELYCPVSKFQILCFQSFEQVPALAHFSTVGIGSRAGRAGPRKLVNRSGFLLIKEASASYHTHRKTPPCIRQTYPPTRMRSKPHDLPSSTALRSRK